MNTLLTPPLAGEIVRGFEQLWGAIAGSMQWVLDLLVIGGVILFIVAAVRFVMASRKGGGGKAGVKELLIELFVVALLVAPHPMFHSFAWLADQIVGAFIALARLFANGN